VDNYRIVMFCKTKIHLYFLFSGPNWRVLECEVQPLRIDLREVRSNFDSLTISGRYWRFSTCFRAGGSTPQVRGHHE
jgi:hypothetical protein